MPPLEIPRKSGNLTRTCKQQKTITERKPHAVKMATHQMHIMHYDIILFHGHLSLCHQCLQFNATNCLMLNTTTQVTGQPPNP